MSATLKDRILKALGQSDDPELLSLVYSVIEAYEGKQVAGYDARGNPLAEEDVAQRLADASDRMDSGNHISSADIRKRVADWQ